MSFKKGVDSLIAWAKKSRKPVQAPEPGKIGKFLDIAAGTEVHDVAMKHLKSPASQKSFTDAKTFQEKADLFSRETSGNSQAAKEFKDARNKQNMYIAGAGTAVAVPVVGGAYLLNRKRKRDNAILDYYRSQGIQV